jgi:hypothetical protein
MTAWKEAGRKAMRYLGTSVPPQYLKRGDILTGWEYGPVGVVESEPVPHPTQERWWLVEVASPYGVGTRVFSEGATAAVGRVSLVNTDPGAYLSLLGAWQAPCGCVVNKGEHCEECGPYNGASPLCMNRWEYTRRTR